MQHAGKLIKVDEIRLLQFQLWNGSWTVQTVATMISDPSKACIVCLIRQWKLTLGILLWNGLLILCWNLLFEIEFDKWHTGFELCWPSLILHKVSSSKCLVPRYADRRTSCVELQTGHGVRQASRATTVSMPVAVLYVSSRLLTELCAVTDLVSARRCYTYRTLPPPPPANHTRTPFVRLSIEC